MRLTLTATIIAAQSIYAEKFIAPEGSNNWSKQGLLIKTGTNFDYLLKITNETKTEYSDLVVYDTLPRSGDKNVFGTQDRSSEFDIHLRRVITPAGGLHRLLYHERRSSPKVHDRNGEYWYMDKFRFRLFRCHSI